MTIGSGQKVLLTASATVHSIRILNGGEFLQEEARGSSVLKHPQTVSERGGRPFGLHIQTSSVPDRDQDRVWWVLVFILL